MVEDCLCPIFAEHAVQSVNALTEKAHSLTPGKKTLISPYGIGLSEFDHPDFEKQMAKLKVDIIAYQDEVGCVRDKFTLPRLKKNWQRMRDIHNRLNIEMWQVGEQRHNFAVGVNGGINLNSVSFSPSVKQKNLMGINGGVTARYISEKYFSMICGAQIELNFSQHGWDEYYEDYPTLSYTRTMNYVEIPFLAHLAFGKDRGLQFFIHRFTDETQLPPDLSAFACIYLPLHTPAPRLRALVEAGAPIAVEIPRGLFGREAAVRAELKAAKQAGITTALAHTLGAVRMAQEAGLLIHGGFGLNLFNTQALEQASSMGLEKATLSFELTLAQAAALGGEPHAGPLRLLRLRRSRGLRKARGRGGLHQGRAGGLRGLAAHLLHGLPRPLRASWRGERAHIGAYLRQDGR